MDRIQQLNYEKDFRIAFLESKGDGFQRLFEKLMSKVHPNDFMACRPWGNVGDRKNDGYLPSARILYQSYAPNELTAAEAIKKINEDFDGAKEHWEEYFDEWTFVHNAPDGRLGPHIIEVLAKLGQGNPQIKIGHYGYEEMLKKFRQLSLEDLESWFGPSLTMEANVNLGFGDLAAVLTHISITPVPTTSDVKDVSRGKIEANLLSQAVADFLKIGMQKSPLVAQFFNNWKNPTYGEQIAQAFKIEYVGLRDGVPQLHPDEIFGRLEAWAGGTANTTPAHKAAVLAVMAYLFDKCEIFEDAQSMGAA
nr:ABC-three component system protein [Xanthomonas cannabis]